METDIIRSDFDRLALLDDGGWDHNRQYHAHLLKALPEKCENVLEIGCGAGSFSRQLSRYANRVLALDLSPQMIKIARQRSTDYGNIEYQVADVLQWDFPEKQFDCIATIAALHHLPLEWCLHKVKTTLRPNGVFIALDLYEEEGLGDWIKGLLATPVDMLLRFKNLGRLGDSEEVIAAWAEHGAHDTYLRVSEVRRICADILPGAVIYKHLLWRYSIVWENNERMWE